MIYISEYNLEQVEFSKQITKDSICTNKDRWIGFLKSSAFLYKYEFENQISLFANSHKANIGSDNIMLANLTACATADQWRRLGANVNENARSLPIIKDGKVVDVYDITDTNSDTEIWKPYNTKEFYSVLAEKMNTAETDLKAMADERISRFVSESDFAVGWQKGKNFQANSIKLIVYTRCGIPTDSVDTRFMDCNSHFKKKLESAEKNIILPAKTILREIEKSVREYENIIKNRVTEHTLQLETQQISEKTQVSSQTQQPVSQRSSQPTQRSNTKAQNPTRRRSYTNEEIQAARNIDLVDFLTRQGEQLKKVGTKEYTLPEHDSMRISGSKFYWNSQSFGGNAIDFCLKYYGMSFQDAVSRLLNYNSYSLDLQAQPVSKPKEEAKPKPPVKPIPNPLDTNRNRIIEYLTKTRGISPDIVHELIVKDKLAQDIMGNAVFKIYDIEGKLTGAEIVGTVPEKRFKELTEQKGNTFIFNSSLIYPTSAIFFESAIDAISYYNLHRNETSLLVSMAGLKQQAVLNVMDRYGIKAENCLISADNDDKGRNFMKKMKDEYNINSYPITVDGRFYSYENIKDWNDLLKVEAEKNRKLRNEFIKNYFDSNEIFAPSLASDEMTSVAEEFFNYDNSWHSVSGSIADIAARYRNGENVYESSDWVKAFGSSAFTQNIMLTGDEKRANGFDFGFIEFTVETGDEGITFRYEDMEKFFSWEDFGKGQFNYIKSYFRDDIENEYNYETQPVFNNYGEEPYDLWVDASEREKSEERLERLLKRIDGKELNLNPVGSFYELYGREAQTAADILGLKLTEKVIGGVKTPMVGFPNFALKENIKKLTDMGYIYNIKEDPSVISALEKYNPLYLKDNTDEQYISNARHSVFKNNRIVSDNGNFKLIADRISPSAANEVVIVDLMNLSTAAIYISTENLEIDYSRSERENSAQHEMEKETTLSEDKNIFEYQGYHFKPVGNFLSKDDFNSLSRNIVSHSSPYMSVYEDSETPYSRNDFYRASHNSTADVFLCVETGKIFTPGENMLFEFTGEYEPLSEIEKTVLLEEQQENAAETIAETVLPEKSMPDISITADDRNKYGYTSDELLPLNTEKALELFDNGLPIYLLYNDNTEALAENRTDIENFVGIFGIEVGEWEKSLQNKQNIINTPSADKSSLGLTKTVDLETEKNESEVLEKEAFTPKYIYKMEANPLTTSREDLYFIQSYITKENGKADIGDILYFGTPEKCQELMEKLRAGEMTQEEVKDLYENTSQKGNNIIGNTPFEQVYQKSSRTFNRDTADSVISYLDDIGFQYYGKINDDSTVTFYVLNENELSTIDRWARICVKQKEWNKKADKIFAKYKNLPLQTKINILAESFGFKTGKIYTEPCTGTNRGTSDTFIRFDSGSSLYIGNHYTPKTKTVEIQTEFVDRALREYNPEIIKSAKEAALPLLLQREVLDNAVAAEKGLKPYKLLNIELYNGIDNNGKPFDNEFGRRVGYYYVTLSVGDKICTNFSCGFDIAREQVSPTHEYHYGIRNLIYEKDVDYVFDNSAYSSTIIDSYSDIPINKLSSDVLERAKKTLAERRAAEVAQQTQESEKKISVIKQAQALIDGVIKAESKKAEKENATQIEQEKEDNIFADKPSLPFAVGDSIFYVDHSREYLWTVTNIDLESNRVTLSRETENPAIPQVSINDNIDEVVKYFNEHNAEFIALKTALENHETVYLDRTAFLKLLELRGGIVTLDGSEEIFNKARIEYTDSDKFRIVSDDEHSDIHTRSLGNMDVLSLIKYIKDMGFVVDYSRLGLTKIIEKNAELQKKSLEIFDKYKDLSLQDKMNVIAQAFGYKTGDINYDRFYADGTTDVQILFDDEHFLFLDNCERSAAKTIKVQTELVDRALKKYNADIIKATKEAALPKLLQREAKDNAVAIQKGLKPYTLLNVEFNNEIYGEPVYYVTLAVDDKIYTHSEAGLNYDISNGTVSAEHTHTNYFTSTVIKEKDVDYVFNNVGFSSVSDWYSVELRDDVRERAEKTLAERRAAESTQQKQESGRKTGIIGNTTYRYIPKKRYRKFDVDTAEKIADAFEKAGLKYSGVVGESTTTLTFSGNDIEKAEAIIEQVKNNKAVEESNNAVENASSTSDNSKSENTEKSSIHFGLMGNGITVYDVSKEKNNDYLTVAHISDEGVINFYANDLKESDRDLIQKEADRQKADFTDKWNSLSNETKYDRILSAADAGQLTQITSDMISMEEKVKKYEHSIIFKDEKFPTEYKVNIIGNTPYRNIQKKHYEKFDNASEYSNPVVEKICAAFEEADIKYSGRITSGFTTLTFSKDDIEKAKPIIDSIANKQTEVDKKTENTEKEAAPTITQEDIDSVLINGSGFKSGKYRIYRQFQKQEKSKVNADFLKKEYGTGSGTHNFPDGIQGWTNFDTKGISITKYGDYDNPDVKLNWSQAEKQIKKLISEDRYFTDEDNKKYPEFLKSVNAPQYEIDNFIKSVHQKFIQSKSKLPPAEKRDSLALRLSDFIRYLDGYEQGLLKEVGRTDLADISADEMETHLSEPETVQQLLDFLKNVQGATSNAYSRSNALYFRQELLQLYPMQYVCKADDIVYIDSEKYDVLEADNNNFILRNTEMALDTRNLSFDELQKQLSGNAANDVYKRVILEDSVQNIAQNQQVKIASAPTVEQSQNKAANINVNSILGQSFSQNIIDLFLQQGSNTDNARMVIATEFMKQKPIEEIAESLKTIYHGGFGIQAGNRAVSAWHDENGIHLSAGKTARYNRNAQVISWTDAAECIGQLLNEGTFESNVELAEANGYERAQLAEKVLFLYRDISDEGREQSLFSSLKTALSGVSVGFPEQKSFLKEKLSEPEFRKTLSADFDVFKTAYKQNRDVLRFHYHKVDSIDRDLKELELPRIGFESDMTAVPAVNGFITDDEIDADLARGSGVEGGKGRIYNYFTKNHTLQEKADFLKNEYGIGGHSHALSGSTGSDQWHDSKGINYKKKNCKDVKMSWSQAAKRISEIIEKNEYLSKEAKNPPKEKPDKEQKVSAEQPLKNNVDNDITEENSPDKGIDKAVQDKTETAPYIPIYKNTGKYAAENGEMDLFRASNRENRRCREAIEKAISENFDGMNLNPKAVDGVLEKFGVDRFSYLLAATIKAKDYDKRFSTSNRKWADSIDTSFRSPDSFSEIINSHSAILDGFIRLFRDSIEKDRELAKPDKEKTFEDISENVNKPVEYFTPTVKAVINDLSTPTYKRYNVRIWSSTDGKNYTDTGNGRYFNDLDMAKNFATEIIDGKYDDIIAFTAKYDEIYKELVDNPEKLNEYRVNENDFDEAVNNDSYKYYLKYISVRGDDFTGDREQTAFVLALNEISRQKYLGSEEKEEAEAIAEPVTDTFKEKIAEKPENYHITDYDFTSVKPRGKFRDNINAIRTLFTVESENRKATPEEQEVLSKYVGWGGLADAFDAGKYSWISEYNELKNLLPEKQYNSARASVTDSFYTPPVVISSIYKALKNIGFEGGRILEPSMGVGNFFGMLPEELRENSKLYGVEIDDISGRIAKLLYPNANIQIKGFEDTSFNSNSFDLAVGNVPFGNIRITDKDFKERNLIHDYFFKKSLERVRPGGVVAFITSKGTLDKKDSSVRKYLAERADLIGAIRLPDNVFKRNAGTEVTSDIIFLQKREFPRDLEKEPLPDWVNVSANLAGIEMNSYFIENPQMVLGEMQEVSGRFGTRVICSPYENADLSELLEEAVSHIKKIEPNEIIDEVNAENTDISQNNIIAENASGNENISDNQNLADDNDNKAVSENKDNDGPSTIFEDEDFENEVEPIGHRNFCYDIVDGKIYFRENDKMKKQDLKSFHTKDAFERLSGMIEISKCLQELIRFQLENYEDEYIVKQQKKLNKLYDDFTAKYGLLSSRSNKNIFKDDDTAPLLQSLENLNEKGELESKADIFTKRTIIPYTEITSVDTASEALAVSISEKAKVDLDFMSELCSKPKDEIVSELEGVIFENPFTKKYETADEYLSGNVRKKLADTEKFVKVFKEQAEKYTSNIEALKKVQPADLLPSEIFVQLGSTWIPPKYYEEFMYDLLETPDRCKSDNISFLNKDPFSSSGRHSSRSIIAIDYNEHSATFAISNKSTFAADSNNMLANKTYGTDRKNAYQILEDSLNMKQVKIFDYYEDIDGKKKAVLNQKETILAQNKQTLIKNKFKEWIFDDAERTKNLCRLYNDKFNCDNPRQYNGEHINFVGMNPEITLREHQRNAIAHTLYGGNTLLAHSVGAGKSFEIAASAMESKRLGLCHKSLIAVPKSIVNQMAKEFMQLYPAANILVPGENDFSEKNRRRFCSRIATGNYDAIIISHNQLEKIPLSKERQIEYIQNQIDEIIDNLAELKRQKGERGFTVKELEATKKNLQNKLKALNNDERRDTTITFEELGVDKLYVDETHFFKNLFFTSKMGRNVAGINTSSNSQRATDLQMKCQYLDEITGSKGVVFATGTPVSNSIAELFTMQRYLQNDKLKELHIDNFDSWASTYAETKMALELAPEGKGYQMKTRFAKFSNLPELMNMFKEVADVKTADVLNLPVPEAHFHTISAEASQHQKNMVDDLAKRAEKIRNRLVDPTEDNMLAVTNDGRKLALDQRLMNPLLPDEPNSKINLCVENVFKIWQNEAENKSTQIIFSDLSTPNTTGFNVYDDIKKKLIDKGIPQEQIAFIHDCKTDVQKQNLFTKVNNGEVRVLLGSTSKLGTGVNCQKRLKAAHHVDCPWKPADLAQRNGRIIRQGNLNKEVDVYNYVTKSTFDSYLFQIIENKQRFISQIMTSKSPARSAEDVDESVLNYAQIKAIAAGDPRIQEKMNLDIEVAKLHTLFGEWQKEKRDMQNFIMTTYPAKQKEYTEMINAIDADNAVAEKTKSSTEFTGMTVRGKLYSDKKEAGQALLTLMSIVSDSEERPVGEYRGFKASVKFDSFSHEYNMILRNNSTFTFPLGNDIYGNITRIDNAINSLDNKRSSYIEKLEALEKNAANTKAEIDKPFSRLDELHEKEQRLETLNVELTMKNNDTDTPEKSDSETKDKKDIPIKMDIPVKSEKKKEYAYR